MRAVKFQLKQMQIVNICNHQTFISNLSIQPRFLSFLSQKYSNSMY